MPEFFDVNNNEAKPVIDNCRSGEWASFFLKKQPEFLSPGRSTFRRRTTTNAHGTGPRNRSRDMETEQQQEQENRNYNVNVNNNHTNVVDNEHFNPPLNVDPDL